MTSTILQLSQLISTSVTEMINICSVNGLQIPDLDDTFTPESEAFRTNATVARAANNIAAAAFQLAACVLPPQETVTQLVSGHMKSAAMRVAVECHVPEILREAGSQGQHADVIAAKTGVDARLLRVLANRHMFREIEPDVFVNNRISSSLDTGKSVEKILNAPEAKYDDTAGGAAVVEMLGSDAHKASAYLLENMKDPITSQSEEPYHAPFQRAFGVNKHLWEFFAEPDQAYRRRRFGVAMKGFVAMDVPDVLLKLFNWASLPENALIVDVGGGIGSTPKVVLKAHPRLKFVVQDFPSVIKDGIESWNQTDPEAVQSKRIQFQAHDFFKPQPITGASMFVLKNILHDWSDGYNTKILSHLRHAATPDTMLLICDIVIIPSASKPVDARIEAMPGTQGLDPPSLLSTGYTSTTDMVWTIDIAVMLYLNAQEYTIYQFDRLLARAGWKIVKALRSGSSLDSILAKPI